jgi:predicted nucleotidyltransferase
MDKTTINNVTAYLKKSLITTGMDVEGIALFGSALTGRMHKESDIDLIIISKSFKNKDIFERAEMTLKQEIETQRKFNIPLDVLNMSPEEYENAQQAKMYKAKIVA